MPAEKRRQSVYFYPSETVREFDRGVMGREGGISHALKCMSMLESVQKRADRQDTTV